MARNDGFFGVGSDGAVTLTGANTPTGMIRSGTTYYLDKVFAFTDLTINNGVTLVASTPIFVSGTLTNNGTITLKGADGAGISGGTAWVSTYLSVGLTNYAAGYGKAGVDGGNAAVGSDQSFQNVVPGLSGGAGGDGVFSGGDNPPGWGGTGAGYSYPTDDMFWMYRPPRLACAGDVTTIYNPYALRGLSFTDSGGGLSGAGTVGGGGGCGGGGGAAGGRRGGGGGAGGGVMVIAAHTIVNAGTMTVAGGVGGNGNAGGTGGGGGGAGGLMYLYYRSLTNSGTITAAGGAGGTGIPAGVNGSSGTDGHIFYWEI